MTARSRPHARISATESPPSDTAATPGLGAATAISYLTLWMLTGAGRLAGDLGLRVTTVDPPRDALPAATHTVAMLFAHNAPIAIWPLALIALDWPQIPLARRIGDVLIAGELAGHGLLVGAAVAQQPGLWRYLPHLPLEWLALALPAGAWLTARTSAPLRPRETATLALSIGGVLLAAGIVETYLVPIP